MPGKRKPFSVFDFFAADSPPSDRAFDGGYPYKSMFWTCAGNFSKGVSRSKPWAKAPSSSVRLRIAEPKPAQRPPSKRGRLQSLMIREGSKSYLEPRPLHAGHAP